MNQNGSKLQIQRIVVKNWYIIQGIFNADIFNNGIYYFKRFNIIKYDPIKKQLIITIEKDEYDIEFSQSLNINEKIENLEKAQLFGTILDFKLVDKWFINNKKLQKLDDELMKYIEL